MKKVFMAVALLATSVFTQAIQGKPAPYVLETRKKDDSTHIITLRNTFSRRVVWTRQAFFNRANWSSDHRAVIVEINGGLLVWREKHNLLRLELPPNSYSQVRVPVDYTWGCVWSPDRKRFLVLGCLSTITDGDLFSYNLEAGKKARYIRSPSHNSYVRKMKWRDNRTAVYWVVTFPNHKEKLTSYLWRVP